MIRGTLVLVVAMVLAACSSEPDVGPHEVTPEIIKQDSADLTERGHLEQAAALSDGVITEDEVYLAFDLLRSCLTEGGLTVSDPYVNPVDGVTVMYMMETNGLDSDASTTVDRTCGERYWSPLMADYVGTHPHVVDPVLRDAVAPCMVDGGIDTVGDEVSPEDFAGPDPLDSGGNLSSRATIFSGCVDEGMRERFPEVPAYALAL